MLEAYRASKRLVEMQRSGDGVAVTAFHSARMLRLLSRSVCGNRPAVLHPQGLPVRRCARTGKGCGPKTRDTNGCCDIPLFLFWWWVTGKLKRKKIWQYCWQWGLPSTSFCKTTVSCLWLLNFLLAGLMLPAPSVFLMPDASGRLKQRGKAAFEHTSLLVFCQNLNSSGSSTDALVSPWLGAESGYLAHLTLVSVSVSW